MAKASAVAAALRERYARLDILIGKAAPLGRGRHRCSTTPRPGTGTRR